MTGGGGTHGRSRAKTQEAENGGNKCAGTASETQSCNSNGCPGMSFSVRSYMQRY